MAYATEESRAKHREEQARYRAKYPGKDTESSRQYRLRHPLKVIESRKRHRLAHPMTPAYKRKQRLSTKKNHPDAWYARRSVAEGIREGRIIRPNECSKCGNPCKPDAHHPDYSKRLEIVWLCKDCHRATHIEIRDILKERLGK